jgi:uncharacterized protein YqcC (DUF446 family)
MKTVLTILSAIEAELKVSQLWSAQRPSDEALASTQPFCLDTLTLPQWIQFILLERLRMMIEQQYPLPTQCGVEAIAEEYFKHSQTSGDALIELLRQLDEQLTR